MNQKYVWDTQTWPNFSWNNAALLAPLSEARKSQAELLSIQALVTDADKKRITPNYTAMLTEAVLYKWHTDLFLNGREGLKKVALNRFRYDPRRNIAAEVQNFLMWWNEPPLDLDTLIRAAIAHLWFTSIQPFEDGADDILFQLTDLAFAQDEKCEFRLHDFQIQVLNHRESYFEILEKTQTGTSDITDWVVWFLKEFSECCKAQSEMVNRYMTAALFWQKNSFIELNERQRKILNFLLISEKGFAITNRLCVEICSSNREAIKRDLSSLVEKKLLKPEGLGRAVGYVINN
jgi:Fic family protein